MVDLKGQYKRLKAEIDIAIQEVINSGQFIKGPVVQQFETELADYLKVDEVIGCANGTDALQIALMSLDLQRGDEVILPAFSYPATAEVIVLLGLTPVFVDVQSDSFNIDPNLIEAAITERTKVIMPVHLFGQLADMRAIKTIAEKHQLYIIEDNAQAIGAQLKSGSSWSRKPMGDIICTSFFPTKNLGAYGDGGAIYSDNKTLAQKIRMIAQHGQSKKYVHDIVGVNSRLDAIQAAILKVKLKHLDEFVIKRQAIANLYDKLLAPIDGVEIPKRSTHSEHIFHQYTLKVKPELRDDLASYLKAVNIPTMVYYRIAMFQQKAYSIFAERQSYPIAQKLSDQVISLPIHTELTEAEIEYICSNINYFYNK